MKKIIVVGDGVIARSLLHFLNKLDPHNSYTQVSANDFYPPCSDSSTATVALRKTEKGLSELGDLIVNSFETFQDFYQKEKPKGIEQVPHYHQTLTQSEKFLKRFGAESYQESSYLINWQQYKNWLIKEMNVNQINDVAISTQNNELYLKSGHRISFDKLIWCTGQNKNMKLKLRPGSYLEKNWKVNDSKIFEIDGLNILFRSSDQKLLLGSTTLRDNHYIPPINNLRELHQQAETFLKSEHNLDIGAFETFEIRTGLRNLGSRMPFFGKVTGTEWSLYDFHKNGYLMSVYVAQKIAKEVINYSL